MHCLPNFFSICKGHVISYNSRFHAIPKLAANHGIVFLPSFKFRFITRWWIICQVMVIFLSFQKHHDGLSSMKIIIIIKFKCYNRKRGATRQGSDCRTNSSANRRSWRSLNHHSICLKKIRNNRSKEEHQIS